MCVCVCVCVSSSFLLMIIWYNNNKKKKKKKHLDKEECNLHQMNIDLSERFVIAHSLFFFIWLETMKINLV